LPVVSYGCETWSLTVKVSENRVLRKIFESKRDEMTKWRKLLTEELNDLYCSPDFVQVIRLRRMRWAGHVARMEREGIEGFGGKI